MDDTSVDKVLIGKICLFNDMLHYNNRKIYKSEDFKSFAKGLLNELMGTFEYFTYMLHFNYNSIEYFIRNNLIQNGVLYVLSVRSNSKMIKCLSAFIFYCNIEYHTLEEIIKTGCIDIEKWEEHIKLKEHLMKNTRNSKYKNILKYMILNNITSDNIDYSLLDIEELFGVIKIKTNYNFINSLDLAVIINCANFYNYSNDILTNFVTKLIHNINYTHHETTIIITILVYFLKNNIPIQDTKYPSDVVNILIQNAITFIPIIKNTQILTVILRESNSPVVVKLIGKYNLYYLLNGICTKDIRECNTIERAKSTVSQLINISIKFCECKECILFLHEVYTTIDCMNIQYEDPTIVDFNNYISYFKLFRYYNAMTIVSFAYISEENFIINCCINLFGDTECKKDILQLTYNKCKDSAKKYINENKNKFCKVRYVNPDLAKYVYDNHIK